MCWWHESMMEYSGIRSQNFVWPENSLSKSNPWCLILQFSQLKLEQFELSGTVLESSEPADFKTVLGDPKRWSFIGDIDKNATGEFFWDTLQFIKWCWRMQPVLQYQWRGEHVDKDRKVKGGKGGNAAKLLDGELRKRRQSESYAKKVIS